MSDWRNGFKASLAYAVEGGNRGSGGASAENETGTQLGNEMGDAACFTSCLVSLTPTPGGEHETQKAERAAHCRRLRHPDRDLGVVVVGLCGTIEDAVIGALKEAIGSQGVV